jgi:hypothetical protein
MKRARSVDCKRMCGEQRPAATAHIYQRIDVVDGYAFDFALPQQPSHCDSITPLLQVWFALPILRNYSELHPCISSSRPSMPKSWRGLAAQHVVGADGQRGVSGRGSTGAVYLLIHLN